MPGTDAGRPVDLRVPPQESRGPEHGPDVQSGGTRLVAQWRSSLPPAAEFPEAEARQVVESLFADQRARDEEALSAAGRSWGRAHVSVLEMVERLSRLREVLTAPSAAQEHELSDARRMHLAIDRITATATDEAMARAERLSRTDALTGVGNRRAFDETIQWALSAASRQHHDVTVVAVDVDGLKKVNDTRGHAAGDALLTSLVKSFYGTLRDEDMMFRVGGDEFVVLLPFTSVDDAEALMVRVASEAPAFTWGAAGYLRDGTSASELVEAADLDMYRRRNLMRAPQRHRRTRRPPLPVAARLREASDVVRWAWLAPAAALAAALVLVLLPSSKGTPNVSANRSAHGRGASTSPRHGGGTTRPGNSISLSPSGSSVSEPSTGPSASTTGASPAGAGGPTPAVTTAFVSSTGPAAGSGTSAVQGVTGSGGVGGSPPSSAAGGGSSAPPASGGTPAPGSPPPAGQGQSGLVGAANTLLAPVPVVGGNGGLAETVEQLIVGSPSLSLASTDAETSAPSGL
jgi:diguanylate cyclase (GGDEF)-like protein